MRPVRYAVAGRVHTRHETATRGRRYGTGISLRELHAEFRHTLHVWRAVAVVQGRCVLIERNRRFLPTHIVDEEKDDVGPLRSLGDTGEGTGKNGTRSK